MIYRALADLGIGNKVVKMGDIFPGGWLKPVAAEILEKKDKIAPANLPPVEILPRLKANAEKLSQAGIVTVGDYLEAEVTYIARSTGETEPVIRQIKTELYAMFSAKLKGG